LRTEEIIAIFVQAILTTCPDKKITYDFPWFLGFFEKNKEAIFSVCPGELFRTLDLKTDALLRIMDGVSLSISQATSGAKFDRSYVRLNYGATVDGCDYLYYPSASPKRLIVNFSSMGKDRFDRYSRYWDESQKWESDTAYLFFKDDSYKYYIGDDDFPKTGVYLRLIKQFLAINKLSPQQTFSVGGSMGGYGALYYAMLMGMRGVIVAAPQTTLRAMEAHKFRNWIKHARSTGAQWRDIDMLCHSTGNFPYLYVEYGTYSADSLAVDTVLEEYKKNNTLVLVRKAGWADHTVDSVLSKELVDNTIDYFEMHAAMSSLY